MIRSNRLDDLCNKIHELMITHETRRTNDSKVLAWDYEPRLVELITYREGLIKQLINERKQQRNVEYQKSLGGL